ncbi:MAG: ATP-binding protein [Porphyromonadaceae bacterium]|nr:ATP-binding protein [Porphyromonadaceae bacterium]
MPKSKALKKIVILGPESVGKTTLCMELEKRLNVVVVPEYARKYVESLNRHYTYDDVEIIAKEQLSSFKKAIVENPDKDFLIMDTFLIVTKVWFTHVYERCPKWLPLEIEKEKIDLYLILKPDIEWVEDPVRENPHIREYLYEQYKKEIEAIGGNYVEIGGVGNIRTKRALRAINRLKK